jgi:hypothetical protein
MVRAVTWPEMGSCPSVIDHTDAVVVCAGFEERALTFLRRMAESGSRRFHITEIDYVPEVPENRIGELRGTAEATQSSLVALQYRRTDPESVDGILRTLVDRERIHIDVSGMSRLLIVQLVAAIVRAGMLSRTSIIYTEAAQYPPTEAQVRARLADHTDYRGVLSFISSGVVGLTIVPELSTVAMQGQPVRVIAFPSFNAAQFATVCAEINAAAFTILNGSPPLPENAWRRQAIRELNGLDGLHGKDEVDVSTLDYRDTLRVILDTYARYGATQKLIVAPTGSKMQSVAVGLAAGFLGDLQVVYPTPKLFPEPSNYTTGARATSCLSLAPFAVVIESQLQVQQD